MKIAIVLQCLKTNWRNSVWRNRGKSCNGCYGNWGMLIAIHLLWPTKKAFLTLFDDHFPITYLGRVHLLRWPGEIRNVTWLRPGSVTQMTMSNQKCHLQVKAGFIDSGDIRTVTWSDFFLIHLIDQLLKVTDDFCSPQSPNSVTLLFVVTFLNS